MRWILYEEAGVGWAGVVGGGGVQCKTEAV